MCLNRRRWPGALGVVRDPPSPLSLFRSPLPEGAGWAPPARWDAALWSPGGRGGTAWGAGPPPRELSSPRKCAQSRGAGWGTPRAREAEAGGPPPHPLPVPGLRLAEPGEPVSSVEGIPADPASAAVNHPTPRPSASGAGAGARGAGDAGRARGPPGPQGAAGSAAAGEAAGVKRRESIHQARAALPAARAPPAGPALCLARPRAPGLGSRAGPLRGLGGGRRVPRRRPRTPTLYGEALRPRPLIRSPPGVFQGERQSFPRPGPRTPPSHPKRAA